MSPVPLILAVETSSRIGSVALARGSDLLGAETFSASLRHSAEIFPTIGDLLERFGRTAADISQVHINLGPGSFTGLRIAVTVAKSMHLANSASIITVNSLDAITANIRDAGAASAIQNGGDGAVPHRIVTVLDAKRGQFYVAAYDHIPGNSAPEGPAVCDEAGYCIPAPGTGVWRKTVKDCLMNAAELLESFGAETEPVGLIGDGLLHHRKAFQADGVRILDEAYWSPHAVQVHTLGYQKAARGLFADPLRLAPLYLRGPQVTLRKGR
jgi:tRNA threonylcarbamoyladenosine biosynthesis protein TsaB